MRKIFVVQLLFASLYMQAQTKVSPTVAKAFSERFPAAKNVKWGKENAKEYEAEFLLDGVKTSANYDMQGNWKETEKEISVKNLPEAVVKSE